MNELIFFSQTALLILSFIVCILLKSVDRWLKIKLYDNLIINIT